MPPFGRVRRTEQVALRLTPKEREAVEAYAAETGRSLSAAIRSQLPIAIWRGFVPKHKGSKRR